MILVDSSVWIDYLRGTRTPQSDRLDEQLGTTPLAIGDLIMTEVLQGCPTERSFKTVRTLLETLIMITLGGPDVAIVAARNFRTLRARGVTVRKTIDNIIATRCILDGHELSHSDRDFDPFQRHLGLRCVACEV